MAKRIELPEDHPKLISKLICYCYTTDYDFDPGAAIVLGPEHVFYFSLHFHAGMYTMAEKFNLKNPKKLAGKKFLNDLVHLESSGASMARKGNTLTRVLEVIHFIYSTTLENDRDLRDIVVGYVAQNWYAFLALQQFKTFMTGNTEFIIKVIEAKEHVCSRCQKHAAWEKECSSLRSHHSNDRW